VGGGGGIVAGGGVLNMTLVEPEVLYVVVV
jgi:hypothetical protein